MKVTPEQISEVMFNAGIYAVKSGEKDNPLQKVLHRMLAEKLNELLIVPVEEFRDYEGDRP
jgi:hypothetical protein